MANGSHKKQAAPLIGILAVKNQFINQEQLNQILAQCSGKGVKVSEDDFKKRLLSTGLISQKNIHRLSVAVRAIFIHREEHRFGAIALAKGFVNKSVLDLALEDQKVSIKKGKKPRLIGDMMVEAGLLTPKQRDYILKLQKRSARTNMGDLPKVSAESPNAKEGSKKSAREKDPHSHTESKRSSSGTRQDDASDGKPDVPKNQEAVLNSETVTSADRVQDVDTVSSLTSDNQSRALREPETPEEPGPEQVQTEPAKEIGDGIQLFVAEDHLSAYLSKTLEVDPDMSAVTLRTALAEEKIVSGLVDDDRIVAFIRAPILEAAFFKIAQGTAPIHGKESRTEYFFSTEYLKAGGMDEDGNIDFKQRGITPLVEKGTVLAEKIAGAPPKPGMDIHGNTIPGRSPADKPLSFGTGATLSEDGRKVLATVRGYPKLTLSGVITVHEAFITKGDVDYETGHVKFDGNIRVKGRIKSGFMVRGSDITAAELDGGIVEADGDLTVTHGINGAKVYARGNVYAEFINDSRVVCMGDVFVKKEIVDAEIECSGACSVINGRLISSKVSAKMGVMAQSIGTPTAIPSTITVGHDAFLVLELEKNRLEIENVKKIIHTQNKVVETVKKQMDELQQEITRLAHIQEQAEQERQKVEAELSSVTGKAEEKRLRSHLEKLKKSVAATEQKIQLCFDQSEDMEEQIGTADLDIAQLEIEESVLDQERKNLISWSEQNPGKPRVIVNAEMVPGTVIIGKHSQITTDTQIRHARVTELPVTPVNEGDPVAYQMKIGNF